MNPTLLPAACFIELRGADALAGPFPALWTCGSAEGLRRPTVAVVGTRAASGYGRATALRFASELAAAGCCIVSGLALGIDAAAHEGALAANAPTVGILGGGHARFFPRRNHALAERMIRQGGAVLSPFPPDRAAAPHQFLQRNAIVAALADAVVVIEAPARSGALNTASWAAGRIPVFAVPGDVDRPHAAGCHALIRDGAILARNAADVLAELRMTPPPAPVPTRGPGLDADSLQLALLERLGEGEASLADLHAASGADAGALFAALTMLELRGAIDIRPGQRYALRI